MAIIPLGGNEELQEFRESRLDFRAMGFPVTVPLTGLVFPTQEAIQEIPGHGAHPGTARGTESQVQFIVRPVPTQELPATVTAGSTTMPVDNPDQDNDQEE